MTPGAYRRAGVIVLGLAVFSALLAIVGGATWPLWIALGAVTFATACFIAAKWQYGYLIVNGLIWVGSVAILVNRILAVLR